MIKKNNQNSTLKKKQLLSENKVKNINRRHYSKEYIDLLSEHYDDLDVKIQQQTNELKLKNGQLKNGEKKQLKSDKQIRILTKAMESIEDGIAIVDAQNIDFPIIYINNSYQKMTGYAKSKILGRNYFLFCKVNTDPKVIEKIKKTVLHGKSFHGVVLHFQKNGNRYWNLLRIVPVSDLSKIVTHYVVIQTDVTLMREKDLKIVEQRADLLHVTRVGKLAEFVSSLAHEISQPLTSILAYAQAAKRMLKKREPEIKGILQYIINDNMRASQVIARLRNLLKKSKPEMKLLDINTLINETIMLIATDASVRKSIVKVELKDDLPLIIGDKIQLQQVLLNLISNSFDAMKSSRSKRIILLRSWRKDTDTIMVSVKDSGCGIPASNIPKLFTRFFTSKLDGLGMGLSISRSIIESHGGCLTVKNNPDRGVTFSFTIPTGRKNDL